MLKAEYERVYPMNQNYWGFTDCWQVFFEKYNNKNIISKYKAHT